MVVKFHSERYYPPEMWLRVVWQICAYVSEERVISSEWKCGSLFYAEDGSTFL